jgi:hypothetical protein
MVPGLWDKFYARKDQLTVFKAKRTLVLPLKEPATVKTVEGISVDDYLSEPERLVLIVYGPSQFDRLASDQWNIKLVRELLALPSELLACHPSSS